MKALISFTKTSARFRGKKFCCKVLQKSLKEEQRSVFHVFKFSSFRFRRKETFSSFRSNGKGPGLFSPREYSALFSELFVRAHARRRHRAVFRLTRKGTFENGNLLSLKAENGIYKFPKVKKKKKQLALFTLRRGTEHTRFFQFEETVVERFGRRRARRAAALTERPELQSTR